MKTRIAVVLGTLLVLLGVQCAQGTSDLARGTGAEAARTATPAEPESSDDWVEDKLRELRLPEKIAQLMFVTAGGSNAPNAGDAMLLRETPPGGVAISAILRPGGAAEYVTKLRESRSEAALGIPLFIATDLFTLPKRAPLAQEYFAQIPSLMAIAAANDPAATASVAHIVAAHLKAMGFNTHLGPSLELAPQLEGVRGDIHTFGHNPEFIASAGAALVETMAAEGVLAVPVGFPGGGADRLGNEPAVLMTPSTRLLDHDALPYRRAIEAGAKILHVGATYVPTLGETLQQPACLSPEVMRGLLRDELGFEGVILAGPMDSRDIARLMDPAEAAIRALEAGADMLYWETTSTQVMRAVARLTAAAEADRLSADLIDAALTRVLRLKHREQLANRPKPAVRAAQALERRREYPREAYSVERRSITLVQNVGGVLPLAEDDRTMPMGVTGVTGVDELQAALEKYFKKVAQQRIRTAQHLDDIYDFEIRRLTQYSGGLRTVVCVFPSTMRRYDGLKRLIQEFKAKGAQVVLVLVGYPHRLPELTGADAIVLAYCASDSLGETMKAVADVLAGQGPISILPMVAELSLRAGESELFSAYDVVRTPAGALPVNVGEPFVAGLAVPYNPALTLRRADWDFGDGNRARGEQVEHAYAVPGRYPITLTVTDAKGETTQRTLYAVVD